MARLRDIAWVIAGVLLVGGAIVLAVLWRPDPTGTAATPAFAPLVVPEERSIAFLPAVPVGDFTFDTPGFDFISRDVGRAMAREPGLRIADETAAETYRGWQGEPVVAAAALGVRFVFIARLTGDETDARVDVTVTDARNGTIAFEGPFYVDRENVANVPLEIAQSVVLMVLNQVPGFTPPMR